MFNDNPANMSGNTEDTLGQDSRTIFLFAPPV